MSAEIWKVIRENLDPQINGYVVAAAHTGEIPVLVINKVAEPGSARRIKKHAKRNVVLWWLPYGQLVLDLARRAWEANPIAAAATAAVLTAAASAGAAQLTMRTPHPVAPVTRPSLHMDRAPLQHVARLIHVPEKPPLVHAVLPAGKQMEPEANPSPNAIPSSSPTPAPTPSQKPTEPVILVVSSIPTTTPTIRPRWAPSLGVERSHPWRNEHHGHRHGD